MVITKSQFAEAAVRLAQYVIENPEEEQCMGSYARMAHQALKTGKNADEAKAVVLEAIPKK